MSHVNSIMHNNIRKRLLAAGVDTPENATPTYLATQVERITGRRRGRTEPAYTYLREYLRGHNTTPASTLKPIAQPALVQSPQMQINLRRAQEAQPTLQTPKGVGNNPQFSDLYSR